MKCTWQIFLSLMSSAAVLGAPILEDAEATILNYDFQLRQDGYFFTYTTSNGITREEKASLIGDFEQKNILRVNGFYTYTGEDNKIYRVSYESDENGYRIKKPPLFTPKVKAEKISGETKGISSAALASLGGNR